MYSDLGRLSSTKDGGRPWQSRLDGLCISKPNSVQNPLSFLYLISILNCGDSMTEERKHAILLATVILTAGRLQPLLEEDDKSGKPNMATEFWAEVYTKKSMERIFRA